MGLRRFLLAMLTAGLLALGSAHPAIAVVPKDGWGIAIADDDAIGSAAQPPASLSNARFDLLRPKTYRFQIYWDAVDDPNSSTDFIDKARAQISRARAAGVQQVLATFKKHGTTPTVVQYEIGIRRVVQALANDVDVWGPANEPNGGESWLPGTAGAQKLASFNASLAEVVNVADPTAQRTSPDFTDRSDLGSISSYINAYIAAGGGWGHYVAFHPYYGVQHKTSATVNDLASLTPASKPIWITEIGGFGRGIGFNDPPSVQNQKVNWLVNGEPGNQGLANHARVTRLYYYHMQGSGASWDTALLNNDLSPRPAWYTWCAASHGGNATHPDCLPPEPNHFVYFKDSMGGMSSWLWETEPRQWSQVFIGGPLAGDPASAYTVGPNHFVYYRGTDGAIWQWLWQAGPNQWLSTRLGGSAAGDPTSAYTLNGTHYVYFRGTDGAIWQWQFAPAVGHWQQVRLGGSAAGNPASAYTVGPNHFVYYRGTDGAIWQWLWQAGPNQWLSTRLGGSAAGDPTSAYTLDG